MDLRAPEIIVRNEKRMLQEAVDALFDNGHKNRPLVSQNRRKLKSLSDSLLGKTGRFRMNMLGKRVDYSGRSVIVSGPTLKLHQVGLPKSMALELFSPFVFARLQAGGYANTLKTARKMVEAGEDIVWEILEKVIYQHPVLLNRAPSLHRLSILAFEPILIEGKAIRLHPLVTKGFNADFDGDQMSVYVPISLEAQLEARTLMLSTNNVLLPANGEPMIVPSQDMVLGVYYLSLVNGEHTKESPRFASMDEIKMALENKTITLHTPIIARYHAFEGTETVKTTAGRMILGELLPKKPNMPFDLVNQDMPVGKIRALLSATYEHCGDKDMIVLADNLKNIGFEQAARSGISIGFDDIRVPEEKRDIIAHATSQAEEIESHYRNGLISRKEKYNKIVDMWHGVTNKLAELAFSNLRKSEGDNWNSISMMQASGARGSKAQIQQLAGMRGMMMKPDESIIEVPIISNFKEGLSMAEYFTSTHGARKGLSDTALKTATAGYLTRRMVLLAQNAFITEHDCGTTESITAKPVFDGSVLAISLGDVVVGRTAAQDIIHPGTGEVIVAAGGLITKQDSKKINDSGLGSIEIRSVLTCKSNGLCAKCYGMDLSRGALVHVGEAVGVIASHSIGEPGTQLTLRTFHVGGIASAGAGSNFIEAPMSGVVSLIDTDTVLNSAGKTIVVSRNAKVAITDAKGNQRFSANLPYTSWLIFKDGAEVEKGAKIAEWDAYSNLIIAEKDGKVAFSDMIENITFTESMDPITGITSRKILNWKTQTKKALQPKVSLVGDDGAVLSLGGKKLAEYMLPMYSVLNISEGAQVNAGDILARVPIDAKKIYDITGGLPRIDELLEVRQPKNPAILAEIDGEIEIEDSGKNKVIVRIVPEEGAPVEYMIPKGEPLLVRSGDFVKKAEMLVSGDPVAQDILRIQGQKELMTFMVNQIQQVYRLQGVVINNKHIEILIREMTRRVEVSEPGDTQFRMGQVIDKVDFEEENARVAKENGRQATASQVLVSLTRASLTSRSFISNAAFQHTTKILVNAAIAGATDKLAGINENLIVGRLIPVGTGSYVRRVREIAKDEEERENLARENQSGEQQMLGI
jgi:DNA-directed RNA polymerase subunit beta'